MRICTNEEWEGEVAESRVTSLERTMLWNRCWRTGVLSLQLSQHSWHMLQHNGGRDNGENAGVQCWLSNKKCDMSGLRVQCTIQMLSVVCCFYTQNSVHRFQYKRTKSRPLPSEHQGLKIWLLWLVEYLPDKGPSYLVSMWNSQWMSDLSKMT